ncbi:enoyl-CoA hydratase/isomerase family protein [Aeromicrobium sp. Leaf350]|uniref:enoyl-CoA hydratase/isomerase family protein n=1 Tax=Aeromicrobium sp. Leaf350 TaxID=2876565 RepID=UPI001E38B161|nr:enoyl-CoA hydratase/isomerase family protein [Aeromicrobium sp. Leaf350]
MTDLEPRIDLEVDGAVATLTLSGRAGRNAMDLAFVQQLDELTARVRHLADAREVRVVVLRARGRHFCVGGDLADFAAAPDIGAHMTTMTAHAHRGVAALHDLPVPLVVAVHGASAGAAIGLALAGDVVVAERSATFVGAYAAAGLTPDAGVSWGLARAIGRARATDVVLTNRRVTATEMEQWGLVTRLVDDGGLDAEVEQVVAALVAVRHDVLVENKRLLRTGSEVGLHERLDDEAATIARVAGGDKQASAGGSNQTSGVTA